MRMAKAGRPRRAKQERDRRRAPRAESSRAPAPESPPAPRPAPSQQDLVAAAIGAAVQAVCDGSRDAHGAHLDPLAIERTPGWTHQVSRTLVQYLRVCVAAAWQRGWQPAELARHIGRELSADHAAMISDMITAEVRGYPAATVDARWAAQAAALEAAAPGKGAWWGSDAEYLGAWYALGRDAEFIVTVATAVETLHAFRHLPAVEKLLPLPGVGRAAPPPPRPADAAPADERMLGRIRALLAKAESTEFAEEAEALSGRAQELMAKYSIDHALLAAEAGQAQTPGGRRIAVDNPYEAPKATLLQTVAQANRCRVVWSRELGLVTVIGFAGRPGRGRAAVHLAAGPGEHRDAADRRQARRRRAVQDQGVPPVVPALLRRPHRRAAVRGGRPRRAGGGGGAAGRSRRRRRREQGHRPGAVPRGAAPGGRRRGGPRCSAPRSPGAGRSGRPTPTAGTPAAPPRTWPACATTPRWPDNAVVG